MSAPAVPFELFVPSGSVLPPPLAIYERSLVDRLLAVESRAAAAEVRAARAEEALRWVSSRLTSLDDIERIRRLLAAPSLSGRGAA